MRSRLCEEGRSGGGCRCERRLPCHLGLVVGRHDRRRHPRRIGGSALALAQLELGHRTAQTRRRRRDGGHGQTHGGVGVAQERALVAARARARAAGGTCGECREVGVHVATGGAGEGLGLEDVDGAVTGVGHGEGCCGGGSCGGERGKGGGDGCGCGAAGAGGGDGKFVRLGRGRGGEFGEDVRLDVWDGDHCKDVRKISFRSKREKKRIGGRRTDVLGFDVCVDEVACLV